MHALGGRLSCSSVHDIQAGRRAARRVSPTPAPPPRMLDRHVCRSPVLLRAAVKAGVRLFEVRLKYYDSTLNMPRRTSLSSLHPARKAWCLLCAWPLLPPHNFPDCMRECHLGALVFSISPTDYRLTCIVYHQLDIRKDGPSGYCRRSGRLLKCSHRWCQNKHLTPGNR